MRCMFKLALFRCEHCIFKILQVPLTDSPTYTADPVCTEAPEHFTAWLQLFSSVTRQLHVTIFLLNRTNHACGISFFFNRSEGELGH